MRHRKPRRFRHRSNGRSHQHRINGKEQTLLGSSSFSNDRRGIFKSYQSPDKLVEKYNSLAKEALTSGDKILSENYLQHADHFTRILNEKVSFKKEKFLDNKINVEEDTKESSAQNTSKNSTEASSDDVNIENSEKSQIEIN